MSRQPLKQFKNLFYILLKVRYDVPYFVTLYLVSVLTIKHYVFCQQHLLSLQFTAIYKYLKYSSILLRMDGLVIQRSNPLIYLHKDSVCYKIDDSPDQQIIQGPTETVIKIFTQTKFVQKAVGKHNISRRPSLFVITERSISTNHKCTNLIIYCEKVMYITVTVFCIIYCGSLFKRYDQYHGKWFV